MNVKNLIVFKMLCLVNCNYKDPHKQEQYDASRKISHKNYGDHSDGPWVQNVATSVKEDILYWKASICNQRLKKKMVVWQ